jgi:hypothetical protein
MSKHCALFPHELQILVVPFVCPISMVIDAGGGYTFWQVRIRSDQPTFTGAPSKAAASNLAPLVAQQQEQQQQQMQQEQQQSGETAWDYGSGQRGSQLEGGGGQSDMPYLVGGGLGVPGSKARVMEILEAAGFADVKRVVEVRPQVGHMTVEVILLLRQFSLPLACRCDLIFLELSKVFTAEWLDYNRSL